jgi:hypothetical protein
MYTYKVIVSDQAKEDIFHFAGHIAVIYGQTQTSHRYESGALLH